MKDNGYNDMNDWNFQVNEGGVVYWIKHEQRNVFALVKEQGYGKHGKRYTVLVHGFNDFGCFTRTK